MENIEKSLNECKIVIMRFEKKMSIGRNIPSQIGAVMFSIGCKEWNGGRNEVINIYP